MSVSVRWDSTSIRYHGRFAGISCWQCASGASDNLAARFLRQWAGSATGDSVPPVIVDISNEERSENAAGSEKLCRRRRHRYDRTAKFAQRANHRPAPASPVGPSFVTTGRSTATRAAVVACSSATRNARRLPEDALES